MAKKKKKGIWPKQCSILSTYYVYLRFKGMYFFFLRKSCSFFNFLRKHFKRHFWHEKFNPEFHLLWTVGAKKNNFAKECEWPSLQWTELQLWGSLTGFSSSCEKLCIFFNVLSTLPRDKDKARKAPSHQSMRSFMFLHPSTFTPASVPTLEMKADAQEEMWKSSLVKELDPVCYN